VTGGLVVGGRAPSKSYWRFPSLFEELDFQPGAMVGVKGQPIEGREGSVKWERVGIRKGMSQSCVLGKRGTNKLGAGPER